MFHEWAVFLASFDVLHNWLIGKQRTCPVVASFGAAPAADFASKMARLAGFLCPTNFNFRAESQAAFATWKPFWVVLHVALFGEWAGAAVRVYHCLIPPFAVQWRRNFIGKYSSAGLPLVASNSRPFYFSFKTGTSSFWPG